MSITTAAVKAAADALSAASNDLQHLERQLKAIGDSMSSGQGLIRLASAGRAYEDALAAEALGEGSAKTVADAKAALDEARKADRQDAQDAARREAAIVGIRRRMEQARARLEAAKAAHVEAQAAWLQVEFDRADAAYLESLQSAYSAYTRAETLRKELADRGKRQPGSRNSYFGSAPLMRDAAVPIGAASRRAAEMVHGGPQDASNLRFLPAVDYRDAKAVIELELEAISGATPAAAAGGVVASIKRSTRSAAAAVTGLVALVGGAASGPGAGG